MVYYSLWVLYYIYYLYWIFHFIKGRGFLGHVILLRTREFGNRNSLFNMLNWKTMSDKLEYIDLWVVSISRMCLRQVWNYVVFCFLIDWLIYTSNIFDQKKYSCVYIFLFSFIFKRFMKYSYSNSVNEVKKVTWSFLDRGTCKQLVCFKNKKRYFFLTKYIYLVFGVYEKFEFLYLLKRLMRSFLH